MVRSLKGRTEIKRIVFVEPIEKGLVSYRLRAERLCKVDQLPAVSLMKISSQLSSRRFTYAAAVLFRMLTDKNRAETIYVLTKPTVIMIVILAKGLRIARVAIDINDPLHLKAYLGRFAKFKLNIMLLMADKIIFESPEYAERYSIYHKDKMKVIEDVPEENSTIIPFSNRPKTVVWVGSPGTSKVLLSHTAELMALKKYGYQILLLGASDEVVTNLHVPTEHYSTYDDAILKSLLTQSRICFVPIENTEFYQLRGNLKAKTGVSMGCVVVASKCSMHERLNLPSVLMYNDLREFETILKNVDQDEVFWEVASLESANALKGRSVQNLRTEFIEFLTI